MYQIIIDSPLVSKEIIRLRRQEPFPDAFTVGKGFPTAHKIIDCFVARPRRRPVRAPRKDSGAFCGMVASQNDRGALGTSAPPHNDGGWYFGADAGHIIAGAIYLTGTAILTKLVCWYRWQRYYDSRKWKRRW
jgi:hypothetical protein